MHKKISLLASLVLLLAFAALWTNIQVNSQASSLTASQQSPKPDPQKLLKAAAEACLKVKTAEYLYVRENLTQTGMQFPPITAKMRQERAKVPRVWMAGKFHATGKVELPGESKDFAYAYDGQVFRYLDLAENVVKVMKSPARDGVGPLLARAGLGIYTFPEFTDDEPFQEQLDGPGEWAYGGTAEVEGTNCHIIIKSTIRAMETPRGKTELSQKMSLYLGEKDLLPRRYLHETASGGRPPSKAQATARNLRVNQPYSEEAFFIETPSGFAEKLVTETEARAPGLIAIGSAAPEWKLTDLVGREHTLSDYRGKVVVMDFWATWCGPCIKAMPEIQKLHERFKDRGVVVLGIDTMDDGKLAADFMKQKGYTYQLLLQGETLKPYNPSALPTLYVIGPDGKILHAEIGYRQSGFEKLAEIIEQHVKATKK